MDYIEELRPTSGESFQIYVQPTVQYQGFSEPHIHDFIEILYCVEGEYTVMIDAYSAVIRKGEMAVISSRKIHTIIQNSEGRGKYLVVKFQPEIVTEIYSKPTQARYMFPLIYRATDEECVFSRKFIVKSGLEKTLKNIMEEIATKKLGYEVALKSEIYRIVLWFVRKFGSDNSIIDSYSESTLMKIGSAIEYIEQNYTKDITVRQLANYCYMEYSYFSRVFKQIANMSCCDYVNAQRIKKAQILLCTTNMTVTQIGATVGFDSTSYFIKKFREINGISPKQFKKI